MKCCRSLLAQHRFSWASAMVAEPCAGTPAQQGQHGSASSKEHAWNALQALHSGGRVLVALVPGVPTCIIVAVRYCSPTRMGPAHLCGRGQFMHCSSTLKAPQKQQH
jgi:hypothetical protein